MKKVISILVLFIFSFSIAVLAQEKKESKIELPKLYLEQKLDQSAMNMAALITAGIAYAKTMGKTPEEYGQFFGDTFAPDWDDVKGQGVPPFIKWMFINLDADKNFQMEITSESEKEVQLKLKRFNEETVRAFSNTGVTIDEYDRFWCMLWETIAKHLGLKYSQKVEGDYIYATVNMTE